MYRGYIQHYIYLLNSLLIYLIYNSLSSHLCPKRWKDGKKVKFY